LADVSAIVLKEALNSKTGEPVTGPAGSLRTAVPVPGSTAFLGVTSNFRYFPKSAWTIV